MKIKIATIALIFMLPLTTYALSLGNIINSKAISGQQIEQMTKDLDLNPNQVIQINALLAEKGSNYKIINEKLKTILSKDQINKLAALKLKHFQKIRDIQTHLSNWVPINNLHITCIRINEYLLVTRWYCKICKNC